MHRRSFLGMGAIAPSLLLSNRTFLNKVFGITTVQSTFGDFWKPWKTVYKFTQQNGRSSFQKFLPQEIVLDYKVGKTVIPKIGKIFVLSDVDHSLLQKLLEAYRVFQCKSNTVEKPKDNYVVFRGSEDLNIIKRYWINGEVDGCHSADFGGKTMFCDSLKVIKELFYEQNRDYKPSYQKV